MTMRSGNAMDTEVRVCRRGNCLDSETVSRETGPPDRVGLYRMSGFSYPQSLRKER